MQFQVEHDPTVAAGPATAARLQAAVDRAHSAGGGTVRIGPGVYVTTTLFLRSGVELHLERGARIVAFDGLDAYPPAPAASNNKDQSQFHLVAAFDCEDVAITGDGVIDGQDERFWEPVARPEDRLYGIFRFTPRPGPRSRPSPLFQIARCRGVKLAGFTAVRAPGWTVHVYDCDDVSVHGLTVRGHPYGPHTDGIGINGSRNVRVAHCDVDTGDDAIIVKATEPGLVCSDVTVTNCTVASNCAGLGLGADVEGVIRDVVFANCVVRKALRMIQVEMWFAGRVERAVFSGIVGRTFPDEGVENERPIYVDIQEFKRAGGALGQVRDLVFRDIVCASRGRIMLTAQDGSHIEGVTLDTVVVTVPEVEDPAVTVPRATSMQLSNFSPRTRAARAAVVADNVDRLALRGVEYRWPAVGDAEAPAPEQRVPMHGLCLRLVRGLADQSPRLSGNTPSVARVLEIEG